MKNANVSREILAEQFLKIPIIHVYGKIGYLPWQAGVYNERSNYYGKSFIVNYGGNADYSVNVGLATHKMIEIMYEERKDKPELETARELISNADRIMFLGFGYDELNLSILNLPHLLEKKQIFGTAYGATNNEIENIKGLLGVGKMEIRVQIKDMDCLMLLREYLV